LAAIENGWIEADDQLTTQAAQSQKANPEATVLPPRTASGVNGSMFASALRKIVLESETNFKNSVVISSSGVPSIANLPELPGALCQAEKNLLLPDRLYVSCEVFKTDSAQAAEDSFNGTITKVNEALDVSQWSVDESSKNKWSGDTTSASKSYDLVKSKSLVVVKLFRYEATYSISIVVHWR